MSIALEASAACGRSVPNRNVEWFRDRVYQSVVNCTPEDCNSPEFVDGQWSLEVVLRDHSVHLLFVVQPIFERAVRDVMICGRHETPSEIVLSDFGAKFVGFRLTSFGVESSVGAYSQGKWQSLLDRLLKGIFSQQIIEFLDETL